MCVCACVCVHVVFIKLFYAGGLPSIHVYIYKVITMVHVVYGQSLVINPAKSNSDMQYLTFFFKMINLLYNQLADGYSILDSVMKG